MALLRALPPDADGDIFAEPDTRENAQQGDGLRILVVAGKGDPSLGSGDRFLARLSPASKEENEDGVTHRARVIRKISSTGAQKILGIYRSDRKGRGKMESGGRILPVSKKSDREWRIPAGASEGAKDGELVEAKRLSGPRMGLPQAQVTARLGAPSEPRKVSLIALHEHDIPDAFPPEAEAEAKAAKPITGKNAGTREDLRHLPFVTIDPANARDHDDAVAAFPDEASDNPGGHIVWAAIADVAHYVRPGGALDREARKRGNATYFPDRVSPMLPEALSSGLCSLHEEEDRACLAMRMTLNAEGVRIGCKVVRGLMRSTASLTYEQAQAAADRTWDPGPEVGPALERLFAAYRVTAKARDQRQPLDLDLPERRIELNDQGEVAAIRPHARLEAHRLIEEFMILANAAAAEELEAKRRPCLYRVHEEPDPDRMDGLRRTVSALGLNLVKGRAVRTKHLNALLEAARGTDGEELVNMQVLRAQTQAYYSTENLGHFGLNLARYAHFTSPIRRYADLMVHRALTGELTEDEAGDLARTAEHISRTERRSMEAERDTTDRYIAQYLLGQEGAEFAGRISGVARFGLFVKLDDTGADGLVPMSSLGREYFRFDAEAMTLTGERTGVRYAAGQRATVRLEEAAPVTGGLRFALLSVEGAEAKAQSGRRSENLRRKGKPKSRKGARRGRKR